MRLLPRLFLLAVMLCPRLARAQDLPVYQAQAGLDGQIRIVGSDSMDPLVRLWTQEFQKLQPGVKFQISAHGSATAPPALARGEAELGTMSREMSLTEQEDFKAKLGCAPLGIVAAHDALAVFVHRRNPLPSIRLDHLDALYSVKRLTGYPWPIRTWRAFGVKRGWGRDPIRVYTRDGKSGSRALFAEKVLRKGGTMRPEVIEADQMGILDAIGTDIRALGYGPISYAGPQVRVVPLSPAKGQPAILPTPRTIRNGSYALSRQLFIYLNPTLLKSEGHPNPAAPATRAFLAFILSRHGQELVARDGAVDLDAPQAMKQAEWLR